YQSARQALEAGRRKQDITDIGVVAHHRHRLESTIHASEGEERDRLHPRQRPPEVPVPRFGATSGARVSPETIGPSNSST
ncbi:hypothetical protein ACC731_38155, partial [Rhizobium ruizarguesonis]